MFSKSIKFIFGVFIVTAQQHVYAQKVNDNDANLNKVYDRAFHFIKKDKVTDFINKVEKFINNVKTVTYADINYRQSHVDSPVELFTHVILNFIDTLLKLDHSELQNVLTTVSDEIKKNQHSSVNSNGDNNLKVLIARSLHRFAEMSATGIRNRLEIISDKIKHEMFDKYKNKFINLVNTSFNNQIMVNLKSILTDLEQYRTKTEKNPSKLEELARNVIKSILTDDKNSTVIPEIHAQYNSNIDTKNRNGENEIDELINNADIDTSDSYSELIKTTFEERESDVIKGLAFHSEVEIESPIAVQINKPKSRGYPTTTTYKRQSFKHIHILKTEDSNANDKSTPSKTRKQTPKRHIGLRSHNKNPSKSVQSEKSSQDTTEESTSKFRIRSNKFDERDLRKKVLSFAASNTTINKKHKIQDQHLDITLLTSNEKQSKEEHKTKRSIDKSPVLYDNDKLDKNKNNLFAKTKFQYYKESKNINNSSKVHDTPKKECEILFTKIEKLEKEFNLLRAQIIKDLKNMVLERSAVEHRSISLASTSKMTDPIIKKTSHNH